MTLSRLGSKFDARGDMCAGFFEEMYEAGRIPIPLNAKLLEVGCAENDWLTPFKAARPDVHLTGMDQRAIGSTKKSKHPRPGADVLVQGDLLNESLFPPASFDVVIAVSVIEHVGIGRYQDPIRAEGDMVAMDHIKLWLKTDGILYMDVPYRPSGDSTPFRQYNEFDLRARVLNGWREIDRQHFSPDHPDGPYVALVLKPK